MKSGSAVKHQLQQVVFRYVKKQLRENFRKSPETCIHNKSVEAPGGCRVGVCFYALQHEKNDDPRKVLCDSAMLDGAEQARNCPWWKALRTKGAVKRDFRQLIIQGDRGQIAAKYPDIAALLWVLDTDEDKESLEALIREAPEEDVDSEQSTGGNPTQVPSDGKSRNDPPGTPRSSEPGDLPLSGDQDQGRGPVD